MERKRGTKEILIRENVRNEKLNCLKIRMNSTDRNGQLKRGKAEWSKKRRDEWLEERSEQFEEVSWWTQDFKTLCKWTRELERQMKEQRDEKNNKRELKRVLKMASEQMRRWKERLRCFWKTREGGDWLEREEMREIWDGETRDEEEINPDQCIFPHRGLKDRWGKTLKDRWR